MRSASRSSQRRPKPPSTRTRRSAIGGSVAVRVIGHLVDVGVQAGIERDVLLAAADVKEETFADPDARLPLAAEIALWQTLAIHSSDPELGVRAGGRFKLRTMGLVGYVAQFSASLRGALQRVERYGRLFTEAVQFTVPEGRSEVVLSRPYPSLGAGRELAESHRLAGVVRASRDLTGIDIVPVEVDFTFAEPARLIGYRQHFRCPLRFGVKSARIVYHAADFELPVATADETLAGYLTKYADHVLTTLLRGETTRHKVRSAVWSLLGDGTPALEEVAEAVSLPPRTLQRRLAEEGTSLQMEIEQIRKAMAVAVLRDRSVSVEDVAFLLGYSEPSTFFRSFKRWTGTTPRRFRSHAA